MTTHKELREALAYAKETGGVAITASVSDLEALFEQVRQQALTIIRLTAEGQQLERVTELVKRAAEDRTTKDWQSMHINISEAAEIVRYLTQKA